MSAFAAIADAMATLCFCPPERAIGCLSLYSRRSNPSRICSPFFSSGSSIESKTSDSTLSVKSWWLTSCMTIYEMPVSFFPEITLPSIVTVPIQVFSRPQRQRRKVDFPEPFFPITPIISPFFAIRRGMRRLQIASSSGVIFLLNSRYFFGV